MKIIDPGHEYELDWLDGKPPIERSGGVEDGNRLIFVKRCGRADARKAADGKKY